MNLDKQIEFIKDQITGLLILISLETDEDNIRGLNYEKEGLEDVLNTLEKYGKLRKVLQLTEDYRRNRN